VNSQKKKILIIGGAAIAAYFLLSKKSDAADEVPTQIDNVIDSPSIPVFADAAPLQSYLAIEHRKRLIQYAGGNTQLIAAYNKMNDLEIIASWEYVWSYLLKGLKLYRLPGATGIYPDGNWNTTLYDQIEAIRKKYNIFY
jgi:hypothetical protein